MPRKAFDKIEFDFIKEVISKKINIDILRDLELEQMILAIKSDITEDGDDSLLRNVLFNNGNDYLSYRNDLFLSTMTDIYSEEYLKNLIKDTEEIMKKIDTKEKVLLIDGEKIYHTEV